MGQKTLCAKRARDLNDCYDKAPAPIHIAVYFGSFQLCKYVIEKSEEKNPAGYLGNTPLHNAAEDGFVDICKLIMDKIDNKYPMNNFNKTPKDLAAEQNQVEVLILFESFWIIRRIQTRGGGNCSKLSTHINLTPLKEDRQIIHFDNLRLKSGFANVHSNALGSIASENYGLTNKSFECNMVSDVILIVPFETFEFETKGCFIWNYNGDFFSVRQLIILVKKYFKSTF